MLCRRLKHSSLFYLQQRIDDNICGVLSSESKLKLQLK